jgi:hypothetical protein
MVKLFAKYADFGNLHLETMCILGEWEWWALNMLERIKIGHGKSTSLGDAMLAAERFAGRALDWHNIGPEVTNERKKIVASLRGLN